MLIIGRYVFRELAGPSVLGLLVYTSIFLVNWFFRLAEQWVAGSFSLQEIGLCLVYLLPSVLAQTIPMSVLLGVLIGFARLSADSEITALRASGISYYRLLVPTLALALVAWALAGVVYVSLVPWSNTRYTELTLRAAGRADVNKEIRPGAWTRLHEGSTQGQSAALFARGVDASNPAEPWLLDVDLILIDPQQRTGEHWRAGRMRILRVRTAGEATRLRFLFKDARSVSWNELKPDGNIQISQVSSGDRLGPERRAPTPVPRARRFQAKDPRQMTLGELHAALDALAEMDRLDSLSTTQPKEVAELKAALPTWEMPSRRPKIRALTAMEIHKKRAIPVACLVFALAGMPLGIATRRGGRPAAFAISLAVILLWYVVYAIVAEPWVKSDRISPAIGAWLPNLVILAVAGLLMVRLRRQQSVGLYRALTDIQLLGSGIALLLSGVLLAHRLGRTLPPEAGAFPTWLPALGGVLLLGHVLFRAFRDPVSRRISRVGEAFRTPRQVDLTAPDHDPETDAVVEGPMPPHPGSGAPATAGTVLPRMAALRARLERARGLLIFTLLALSVFVVLDVVQDGGEGVVEGASAALRSWQGTGVLILLATCALFQALGVPLIRTLDWWILSSYLKWLASIVAALVLLYVVIEYVGLAEAILQNDPGAAVVGRFFLALLPSMLFLLVPYAIMVSALVTFGLMAKFNETTALRCGGISVFRLVAPVVLVGLVVSVGTFVLHDQVLPGSNVEADRLRDQIKGRVQVQATGSRGLAFSTDGTALYRYERVIVPDQAQSGLAPQMSGLTILRMNDQGQARAVTSAGTATWANGSWRLGPGWEARISETNAVAITHFDQLAVPSLERPEYFAATRTEPDQMTFGDYREYVAEQQLAGYPTTQLDVKLQSKLALPLQPLVLLLMGLPFAFTAGRRGALWGVGIAIILAVTFHVALALFAKLGEAGFLPAMVAAWGPNAFFAAAGAYFLLHVRT